MLIKYNYDFVYDIFYGDYFMTMHYYYLWWNKDTGAGADETTTLANVLREIIPDKPFKIHKIIIDMRSANAPGGGLDVGVFRNVSTLSGGTSTPSIAAGLIAFVSFRKQAAEGTYESKNYVVEKPAMDFDKDDSLNITIRSINTGGASTNNNDVKIILWVEHG